jgi:peptidoglycan/xylan/chitin deacetylase (PgdA/CDA1 family)
MPLSVPACRLREQLSTLAADGFDLVGQTEALAILATDPSRRVVALTFDDGLLDFLNAFTVLQDIGARATLYVPTATVGIRAARWDRRDSTLDWRQLVELSQNGVEIGSHSVNHRPLDVHTSATVRTEVMDSRRELEDRIGLPVVSFCYPHGYTSARVGNTVRSAGYSNACIVGRRLAGSQDDRFALPRLHVRPSVTGAAIRDLVQRGEPGLVPHIKRLAMPAWRLARRTAFALSKRELT